MSLNQPSAPDAEKAVIGAVISTNGAALLEVDFLKAVHFADDTNAVVFELLSGIWEGGGKVDEVTVGDALKDAGIPPSVISEYGSLGDSESVVDYAKLVTGKWRLREIHALCSSGLDAVSSSSPDELLDELETAILALRTHDQSGLKQISGTKFLQSLAEDKVGSVSAGIGPIDAYLGGLGCGRLITIASRPGVGKTTLALNLGANAAAFGRSVALFSLEMSVQELTDRILARESNIPSQRIRNQEGLTMEDWSNLQGAAETLDAWNLHIDETALSVHEIRARSKKLKQERGLDLIIVDYIQLLTAPEEDNREQEVAGMTRGLKLLARELNVPVVAMSQLNRQAEVRGGKPRQSDLRESGSIENDSDQILFLWRENEDIGDRSVYTNVWVGKNRHGPVGEFLLEFQPAVSRFETVG
jgi:replicative DNA helicase